MTRLVLLSLLTYFFAVNPAFAYCSEPTFSKRPPTVSFIRKPSKPYCMTSSSGCEEYEINSYVDSVNRYIGELNDLNQEAATFAQDAIKYANAVNEFAECSAKEAKE